MSLRRRASSSIENDSAIRLQTAIGEGSKYLGNGTRQEQKNLISMAQLVVIILLSIFPWVPSIVVQQKVRETQAKVNFSREQSEVMLRELSKAVDDRRQLKEQVQRLEKDNSRLLTDLKNHGDSLDPENNQYRKAEEIEELYMARIDDIENSIKQFCRNRLNQKYRGETLQFQFNMINTVNQRSHSIVIETLSLASFPHSTLVFHETVERKRLENTIPTKEVGSPCFSLHASKEDATTSQENILFAEKSLDPAVANYSVLISRRGNHPVVIFCAGRHDYIGRDGETESGFARVVSGTGLLDQLAHPHAPESAFQEWRVQSIDILGSNEEPKDTEPSTTA